MAIKARGRGDLVVLVEHILEGPPASRRAGHAYTCFACIARVLRLCAPPPVEVLERELRVAVLKVGAEEADDVGVLRAGKGRQFLTRKSGTVASSPPHRGQAGEIRDSLYLDKLVPRRLLEDVDTLERCVRVYVVCV